MSAWRFRCWTTAARNTPSCSPRSITAPSIGSQKPVGEWNVEEITAKGRRITVVLNGTTIVDANLDDVKDEAVLAKHRDLNRPEGSRGIANTRGHIGFLGHGAHVEFRNIRVKEL